MNKIEGERMNRVFLEYYNGKRVDPEDKDMLDRLVIAGHIEYKFKGGEPLAQATVLGRGLYPIKTVN